MSMGKAPSSGEPICPCESIHGAKPRAAALPRKVGMAGAAAGCVPGFGKSRLDLVILVHRNATGHSLYLLSAAVAALFGSATLPTEFGYLVSGGRP